MSEPTEPGRLGPDEPESHGAEPDGTGLDNTGFDGTGLDGTGLDNTGPGLSGPGDFLDWGTQPSPGHRHAAGRSRSRSRPQSPSHPQSSSQPRRREPVRATIRGLGQLFITAGIVVLLFVVYELWVTNVFGEQKQSAAAAALEKLWEPTGAVTTSGTQVVVTSAGATVVVTDPEQLTVDPAERQPHYQTLAGAGFARMYVPAFGPDFQLTIIEGTDENDLYAGPGHYSDTELPGQPGNFAMAGHRVNKGAPFNDLGLLKSCDAIVVETQDDWFVYRVLPMQDEAASWAATAQPHCADVPAQTGQYSGVYGREITSPSDYAQVLPVPHVNSSTVPPNAERLITLTTCNPKFSDRERMIIHGILVKSYAKAPNFLPPELSES